MEPLNVLILIILAVFFIGFLYELVSTIEDCKELESLFKVRVGKEENEERLSELDADVYLKTLEGFVDDIKSHFSMNKHLTELKCTYSYKDGTVRPVRINVDRKSLRFARRSRVATFEYQAMDFNLTVEGLQLALQLNEAEHNREKAMANSIRQYGQGKA